MRSERLAKEKSAKEKKRKVPKQIAGMKVPKKVRKAGNKALALADNPAALELAAAALTAAATALKAQGRKRSAEMAPSPATRQAAVQSGSPPASPLADLVKVAALEGARRLLDSVATAAQAAPAGEPGPARPKRRKANGGAASEAARDE